MSNDIPIIPGTTDIGVGYNIFGEYASAAAETLPLFDWARGGFSEQTIGNRSFMVPSLVTALNQSGTRVTSQSGYTITEVQQGIATKAGLEGTNGAFSGSINAQYNSQQLQAKAHAYCHAMLNHGLWQLYIEPGKESQLRDLMYSDVQEALDNSTTEQEIRTLFKRYGSHYLAGISMGGRAVLSAAVDVNYTTNNTFWKGDAKLAFEKSAGLYVNDGDSRRAANFAEYASVKITAIGGNPGKFPGDYFQHPYRASQDHIDSQFRAWIDSVDENPTLQDFRDQRSLIPIWTLCSNVEQQNRLQEFFETTWAKEQAYLHSVKQPYVDAFGLGFLNDSLPVGGYQRVEVPNLTERIGTDSGDDYMYFRLVEPHATDASQNPDCLTDIGTVWLKHKNDFDDEGYTLLEPYLFEEDDKKLYFTLKFEPYNPDKAIRAFKELYNDTPTPTGFQKIPQNLIEGAFGRLYRYLAFNSNVLPGNS